MTTATRGKVFDYRALRLLMGLIAFSLPIAVTVAAMTFPSSISASYHTNARDVFVGMLFIVSAFLWAYNGHTTPQMIASKFAALAAMMVALFPTACDTCETTAISIIHYVAAAALFSILAFFCIGPFRTKTKKQHGKKKRRSVIYLTCGIIMIACILAMAITSFALSAETMQRLKLTYIMEAIALFSFGVAWIVAGKYLRVLVDEPEALSLFR
jgi:hypothetical protein